MKRCSKCKSVKPESDFNKRSRNKDGLEFFCRSCAKLEYSKTKDVANEKSRIRYSKNKEYFIAKSSKAQYKKRGTVLPDKFEVVLSNHSSNYNTKKLTYADTLERLRVYKNSIRDIMNKKYKEWSSSPRAKELNRLKSQRRKAKEKGVPNTLTQEDVIYLLDLQNGRCGKCKKKFSQHLKYEIDHILPLSLGGGLTLDNSQLLCRSCNASKGTKNIRYIPKIDTSKLNLANGEI